MLVFRFLLQMFSLIMKEYIVMFCFVFYIVNVVFDWKPYIIKTICFTFPRTFFTCIFYFLFSSAYLKFSFIYLFPPLPFRFSSSVRFC